MNKHTIHVIVINLLATNYLVVFVFNSHGGKMKKYFCIPTLILLQVPCNASVVCEVGVDDLSRTITEEGVQPFCSNGVFHAGEWFCC